MKKKLLAILMLILLAIGLFATVCLSADVPKMTKEELKTILGNPGLLILDVRLGRDFMFSDVKIKGAERPSNMAHVTPSQFSTDIKDKTIVFYCADPNEGTSAGVAQKFIEQGFTKVYVLKGGWEEWLKAGYPTEKK